MGMRFGPLYRIKYSEMNGTKRFQHVVSQWIKPCSMNERGGDHSACDKT